GGALALTGDQRVSTVTPGPRYAATVPYTSLFRSTLSDAGSGIIASASSTASGNAGSVMVTAPQIALAAGVDISSTTAGTGAGGWVGARTPGLVTLERAGGCNTHARAPPTGAQPGP